MEQKKLRDAARLSLGKSRQLRKAILEKAEKLTNSLDALQKNKNVTLTARLEEIDDLLKQLRLACMEVIFYDFDYAHEKETEGTLWQMHVVLNTEYRRVVAHVNTQNQVVLKRKVDKLYRDFLKTSQFFYRGYIQRLSGQFHIPELQQVAHGLQVDPFVAAQQDPAPSSALRTKLVGSCYLTLVRMGDLARYRCQHTEQASKTSLDIALTYYGLAQMLDPDDGASYHQTAVLYQPSANQLAIVYYFLRSVCVAKPHKLGAANLERALKGVLSSQPGSKGTSKSVTVKDPNEALTTWFLKLHAHYFQGAKFSAQTELEKEVLHRFEVCLKVEGSEALALRMLLANIAACDFAFDNIKEPTDWTIERSQSCQFTLSFQVSIAVVILRVFRSIVQEYVASSSNLNHGVHDETIGTSAAFNRLLPLVRILFAWIYVSRGNSAQYQDWLEPTVKDLHSLAADVLSLLLPLAIANIDVVESQYLLTEDVETLGLKSYSDRKLPLFFDVQIIPGYNQPKCRKTLKSRKDFVSDHSSSRVEGIWRIRDIICCGIYLAGSATSPLSIMRSAENIDTWVYVKDGLLMDIDQVSMARILSQVKMTAHKIAAVTGDQAALDEGGFKSPVALAEPQQISSFAALISSSNPNMNPTLQPSISLEQTLGQKSELSFDDEMSADPNMAGMVDKLLDEEEEDLCPQSGNSRKDTTYGMDSSAANDVFGNLVPSPVSKAPSADVPVASNGKPIPNLPWDYFYSPSPPKEIDANQPLSSGFDVPRVVANQGGLSTASYRQSPDFASYIKASSPKEGPLSMYGSQRAPQSAHASVNFHSRTPSDANSASYSAEQRAAALDNLKSTLFAQYGTGPSGSPSPSYAYGQPALVNHNEGSRSSLGHRARTSVSSPLANFQSSPDSLGRNRDAPPQGLQSRQVGRYPAGAAVRSPTSRHIGMGTEVQLQPVSPSMGGQRFTNQSTQGRAHHTVAESPNIGNLDFAQQLPAVADSLSSLAFSDPSSLWAGTPAAPKAPQGTVACNGNFFNASTPFGRAGNINNRDDPTHFRNRLQELGAGVGETIAAYDRAILESAMTDITNGQRSRQ